MSEPAFAVAGPVAPVRLYTTEGAARVPSAATVAAAAALMVEGEIGLVVVGEGTEVVGVLSERDVVRLVAAGADLAATEASSVASTQLVWCDASASVHEVAELMMAEYVRHVLVEDDGRLLGVVSARDLLGAYVTGDDPALDEPDQPVTDG
jgi:CBS domain-containing protein